MLRFVLVALATLSLLATGCPKRDLPPESSYDPELVRTAQRIAAQQDSQTRADQSHQAVEGPAAECSRETGGCPEDHVCWDSWYCKQGREDQCSAAGDKLCHKRCESDADCPSKMPTCRELPLFKGSDRGVLEKFCVAEE